MSASGTGIIFQELGARLGFLPMAAVALAQTTLI
jgi:hypothetical protein